MLIFAWRCGEEKLQSQAKNVETALRAPKTLRKSCPRTVGYAVPGAASASPARRPPVCRIVAG